MTVLRTRLNVLAVKRNDMQKASKKQTVRHGVKYPYISREAAALNVSRQQLWYVLTGRRVSKRLLADYRKLKGIAAQ